MPVMFSCFYCDAPDQIVPGICSKCGIKLTGGIDTMTVEELQRIVESNGYRLSLEAIPPAAVLNSPQGVPVYSLAS